MAQEGKRGGPLAPIVQRLGNGPDYHGAVMKQFLRFCQAVVLAAFLASSASKAAAQQPFVLKNIELISFGIYAPEERIPREAENIVGAVLVVSKPVHLMETKVVRGRLGESFGLEYRIIGTPDCSPVRVVVMIEHPLLINPKNGRRATVTRFATLGSIGAIQYAGWEFDAEWQIMPGEWTWKLGVNDKVYLEKVFLVQ
jgi:hypothetical protein